MIDFRYHVVSIVAVILALALGLFLGSTTLQGRVFDDLKGRTDSVTKQRDRLSAELSATQSQVSQGQKFDKALLPYAVQGRLAGQLVSVISGPRTSDSVRKQLFTVLEAAGATVSADIRLQNVLVDPKQDEFLHALAGHVTVPGDPTPSTADGAALAVGQLAAVLGERPTTHNVSPSTIDTVLSTYSAANVVSVAKSTPTTKPGTLALVLSGPAQASTADPAQVTAEHTVLTELLRDLDRTALGAVLAAPLPAQGTGPDAVSFADNDDGLTHDASTVTGVDTPAGLIATVYALAGQVDGVAGQFGLGANDPLPSVSPTP